MRLTSLVLLTTLTSTTIARSDGGGPINFALNTMEFLGNTSRGLVRGVLTKGLGMNATSVDGFLNANRNKALEVHPYALDLTDENWETALVTGTLDPFKRDLPDETTWFVLVHGPDPLSRKLSEVFNEVALVNSSASGGELPDTFKFARIDYTEETYLPTLMWIWKPPIIVILNKDLETLETQFRYLTPQMLILHPVSFSMLVQNQTLWETLPPSRLTPNKLKVMGVLAYAWTSYHHLIKRVPSFMLLALSGFLMNLLVGYFHKVDPEAEKKAAEKKRLREQIEREQKQDKVLKESAGKTTAIASSSSATKRK